MALSPERLPRPCHGWNYCRSCEQRAGTATAGISSAPRRSVLHLVARGGDCSRCSLSTYGAFGGLPACLAVLARSLLAVAWRSNISIGGISDDLCDCERELTIRTMSPPLPPPTLPSPLSVRSAVTRRLLSFFPSVLCGFPAVLMSRGGRADGGRQIEI